MVQIPPTIRLRPFQLNDVEAFTAAVNASLDTLFALDELGTRKLSAS